MTPGMRSKSFSSTAEERIYASIKAFSTGEVSASVRRRAPSTFWESLIFISIFGNTRNVPVRFKETPRLPLQPDLLPQRPAGGEAELLLRV